MGFGISRVDGDRLVLAILPRRIAPTQVVAVYKDNAAQDMPVIDTGHIMAVRKIGAQAICLNNSVAHIQRRLML
jgi:hypothetical protein